MKTTLAKLIRPIGLCLCAGIVLATCPPATAEPRPRHCHAPASRQYGSGFQHFDYVNPGAPKGGRIVQGVLGSFDNLNPLIVKGNAAPGTREYIYESLMARSQDEPFTLYGLLAESIDVPEDRSSITFHAAPAGAFPTAIR